MRFIIFSSHYLPYMGGVENYTEHLAKYLLADGHDVVLVTTLEMDLPEKETTESGLTIYRLPAYLLLKGRYPVLKRNNKKTVSAMEDLSKLHFDLCVINTRFYVHTLQGLQFGKENGIRTIVLEHGTSHLSVHNKILDFAGEKWEHFLTRKGQKYDPEYYGVSLAANEWLKHFGIEASGVLYNAIDIEEIKSIQEKHVLSYRDEYSIPHDATVITFTGRMIEEKGVLQLLKAAQNILKDKENIFFFFAGDGKLLNEVERETADNDHIKCLGRIDSEHIVALLDESDIFCLPSFSEGFSTSILEAAACKSYIITTYRGGSKELVSSPEYGMIIPDNSLENVYEALIWAIEHPEECREAAEACYTRLCNKFTWRQTADAFDRLSRGETIDVIS